MEGDTSPSTVHHHSAGVLLASKRGTHGTEHPSTAATLLPSLFRKGTVETMIVQHPYPRMEIHAFMHCSRC